MLTTLSEGSKVKSTSNHPTKAALPPHAAHAKAGFMYIHRNPRLFYAKKEESELQNAANMMTTAVVANL